MGEHTALSDGFHYARKSDASIYHPMQKAKLIIRHYLKAGYQLKTVQNGRLG